MLIDFDFEQSPHYTRLAKGCYAGGYRFEHLLQAKIGRDLTFEDQYPDFPEQYQQAAGLCEDSNLPRYFNSYGVCDSIEQFMSLAGDLLDKDTRSFVVTFMHIEKEPNSGGGGWRWHKWGPYIGKGTPTCEYLDDEEGFADGVFCYSIIQIAGEVYVPEWKARIQARMKEEK